MARATKRFTDAMIEALPTPPAGKRRLYWDAGQPGLFLRVGARTKTFMFRPSAPDEKGSRAPVTIGQWSRSGIGGTYTVEAARRAFLDRRGEERGRGSVLRTVGELLKVYTEGAQVSEYTANILRKHLAPVEALVATDLADEVLPDLVAKVLKGYEVDGRTVGGPAVADKLRGGLVSMFSWAQRRGKYPKDRALPTIGLMKRKDFTGIGWTARERVPSEGELHQLLDALGIGTGERLDIDITRNPRIPLATRLAVLLVMHVPVRSGAGALSQPAGAADLDAGALRWRTRKGRREEELETPLSGVAVEIVKRLRALPDGETWLVPSPEPRRPEDPPQPIDLKALARLFARLQTPGPDGEPPRVQPDEGQEPFTPHALRALWTTLAGDLGIDDGVAVRVIGHKPEGASSAHRFYDRSLRLDAQRDAVERVSAELERIRRRKPRAAAPIVAMHARAGNSGAR